MDKSGNFSAASSRSGSGPVEGLTGGGRTDFRITTGNGYQAEAERLARIAHNRKTRYVPGGGCTPAYAQKVMESWLNADARRGGGD